MTIGHFNSTSFAIAFIFFLAGAVLSLGALALGGRNRWAMAVAYAAIGGGALALTILIGNRWIAGGHPPLSGLFDAVIFFSWTTVIAFVVAEILFRTRWLTPLVGVTELVFLAYASDCDAAIRPLMPVLQSAWLTIHVFAYMIAYGVMTVACFAAICYYAYLVAQGDNATTRRFDSLTYRFVAFGFPLVTAGILTGAVWANRTWGRYWSWDPKETWSLISWIVYAAFLHLRIWSRFWPMPPPRRSVLLNWLAILGFAAIVFTFLFLKYLPSAHQSQHIYL
jgi:cytochrome c-type biogenesis protein CcsB